MNDIDRRLLEVFYDVQRGLPRQGPGNYESTSRALALCSGLPDQLSVLDIGCGPGMQTLALAKASTGSILAVDNFDEYLDELRKRVEQASLVGRVKVKKADMTVLDFPDETFDLLWCEGAAYIMGIPEALRAWRPFLRDAGYIAFSELVWLTGHPPTEVAEFFADEYPAMTNVEAINQVIRDNGYESVGDFTLPDSAWWDDYYTPLEAKLPSLKQKYAGDAEAVSVVEQSEMEIDVRRRFGRSYGYQFFVGKKVD